MDNQLFIILVIICVLTHIIRSVYEILKSRKIIRAGKLSFVIILCNMILLWLSWFALCCRDIYKVNLPGIIPYLGICLVVTGLILFVAALFTIKALESYEGDLITHGVYTKIRHPMYLGFIFWLIGFPVFQSAFYSFLLSFLFIGNVLFWRYLEEKELEERFPEYREYKKKTLF